MPPATEGPRGRGEHRRRRQYKGFAGIRMEMDIINPGSGLPI
jgi:hypothetical protein